LQPASADRELVGTLAELDQRAATEAIDEGTAKELLLRLREVRREDWKRNGEREQQPNAGCR
jgi:hypothetical protein